MPVMRQRPRRALRVRPIAAGSVAVTVMAAALSACGASSNGVGRLTFSGDVRYAAPKGHLHAVGSGQMLNAGDQVQVASGTATIRLVPNGLLELRGGTTMTVNKEPRLTAGSILIEPSGRPVHVSAANATLVVPSGAAQLALNPGVDGGLQARVYRDKSSLQIPGNPALNIPAPREANLTIHSLLPISAGPFQYHEEDAWDRRFLGTAEAFSRQLLAAATGFDAQFPGSQTHDAAYYQGLLPGLGKESDYVSAFQVAQNVASGSKPVKPGDYLIALAMALRGTRGTFGDRLRSELLFEAQGADWGMVAVDQGVSDLAGVLKDVGDAIGLASKPFSAPGSGQVAFGPPPTAPPIPTRPSGRITPTTAPPLPNQPIQANRPGIRPATTTTTVAPLLGHLPPTGTVLDPLLDPLVDPLIDLLNRILLGRR